MTIVRTVGTLIECQGKILILHRRKDITQGNTWGLPAGRVESGESDKDAAVREIKEETGYLTNESELEYVRNFDWHFDDVNILFPTYRLTINKQFNVKLNPKEHIEYSWITPQECYKIRNLIHGFHDLLEKVYNVQ